MNLTAEQHAVVAHERGHARVAAVAGAGKTTTMVARVLHLLAQGVPARRILVLMFNRAAREDFTSKLAALAPAGQALPEVRTFHSIGHRLTQSLTRWGRLAPRELLADWQRERLLRQAAMRALETAEESAREAALEPERLEALSHFCELVKAEMMPPATLYDRLDFGPDTGHFIDAFEQLESLLEQHGQMTYADLLYRPLRCLEGDSAVRNRVQGFLDHVIVDEYQDINEAQQRLLAVLAGRQADVMVVGDANQCIYEWRGARPDYMLERFTASFGAASDYPLSATFRHGHALALSANHAISANRRRPDQLCVAAPGNPLTSIDTGQGGGRLIEELTNWQRGGRSLVQACILVRSWSLSVSVQLQLLRAGIPFRLSRDDRFVFRLPLVQALAGYLRLAREPRLLQDPGHLLLLLSQPTPFVARERLQRLALRLAESQRWPERHDPLLAGLKPMQRRNLKRRWELLCELPRLAALPPARLLELIVERLDAEKVLKRAAARREKGEEDVRLLDVLIEQADELVQAPEDFIDLLHRPVENRTDGVLITTVHGAKGLEWPWVALWGANEEDFPHYSRDNPLDDERLEEERRLFYVAITRARERLLMLHDGGEHRPSRFIAESAWEDGNRVARALRDGTTTAVEVGSPELVARYLAASGATLPLASARQASAIAASSREGVDDLYTPGQRVLHEVFGAGEIVLVEGNPSNPVIEVRFTNAGRRRLIARRAPLKRLQGEPMP
ncbi:DNA helicase-2 / ATP-dependent DNA helicase PcrA [Modicisalibacter ilicicola DSM 19980]|uniref:DNA 3'-5' helicase n=1 Tax=Modicisalibacter ilicicola DSM 19980 TaxID=1121942 RepID=A0A1M5CGR7_9GAMM|nr:ATP-dependent helicase [Halomonas ilicicola]SHF53797.1 DNA helicase-2 / ATP-dependent DNA helicase PcrA [Halomonas ilicicola DSM 19980]